MISNHSEGTFGRLRYSLGGDRPSQTACLKLSPGRVTALGSNVHTTRVVFHRCLHVSWRSRFHGSHLSCTSCTNSQYQATVKLHGVFPSCRGKDPVELSVLSRVMRIFTHSIISPGLSLRQCPSRCTFRAGRNLPDKEFRYLRTVIVTAAVYWGLSSALRTMC